MAELSAIILAAGLSSRMGCNKLLLPLGDTTVLGALLTNFPFPLFHQTCVIVSNDETKEVAQSYPVEIVTNSHPQKGKSGSIHLGIHATPTENGLLFMTGDQPFTRPATIEKIVSTFYDYPEHIICPKFENYRANPVIFPHQLRQELLQLEKDNGGRQIIDRFPERIKFVKLHDRSEFFDIDTPEDYEEAQRLWPRQ